MKENISQKIGIKKLTITRINVTSMSKVIGGTSLPTQREVRAGHEQGVCYEVE